MNTYNKIIYLMILLTPLASISNQELVNVNGKNFKVYIKEDEIKKQIANVAEQIRQDYKDKKPIFIGILSGSVIFLADLVREVGIDCELDFIKISSYNNSLTGSEIRLEKKASNSLTGRDVIIVEDIIDSGNSISYLRNFVLKEDPKSLKIVSLLFKKDTAKIDFDIDYYCFNIASKFIIGYGLDFAQQGRFLKSLYQLE